MFPSSGEVKSVILRLREHFRWICAFDAQWRFSLFNDAAKRILAPYLKTRKTRWAKLFGSRFQTHGDDHRDELRRA
jgi:hypothetical protein